MVTDEHGNLAQEVAADLQRIDHRTAAESASVKPHTIINLVRDHQPGTQSISL
jgi:hypothetical protein